MATILPFVVFVVACVGIYGIALLTWPHPTLPETRKLPSESGTRRIPTTPLPGTVRNWFSGFCKRVLVWPDSSSLELRFPTGLKFSAVICIGVGAWLFSICAASLQEDVGAGGLGIIAFHLVGALAFTVAGIWQLLDVGRVRLDLSTGKLTIRRFLRAALTRNLAEISALQLISGGVHQTEDGQFESFQINLVLTDAVQPRLALIEQDDLAETRQTASRVAEFLGIRLLDETLSAGKVAGT